MINYFNNLSIKKKLFSIEALIFIIFICVSVVALNNEYVDKQKHIELIEKVTYESYDKNIKNQVENVTALLDGIYYKYETGEITLEQSKKLGADLVRNLRYGEEGYFWVDTTEGDNVVLLGSNIEGTNRYYFQDSKGTFVLKNFIEASEKYGSAYQNYWFPKKDQDEPALKRGYVCLFKPFNWVVGTGNYIDDIEEELAIKRYEINKNFISKVLLIGAFFLMSVAVTITLVLLISRNITRPLQKTTELAELISKGILDVELEGNIKIRKDEVGKLASSIEKMKYSIKTLIEKLTEKAILLGHEKELLGITLKSIGDGVITTNQNQEIVLINTIAEQLTGWTQEEAFGKPFEEVFNIINERTKEQAQNPIIKAIEQKKVVLLENNTFLISKDGNKIPIEDSAAPILATNGKISGAVLVFRDVTDKKEKLGKIEYLSYHDQLTGLYNRHFFEEELKRLDVERNLPFSIAMIDVNGLKLTNDAFGHETGDLLLQNVAEVLRSEFRTDDIISRVGGDEFVILLPKTSNEEAELIVKRIYKAIESKQTNNIVLSISIGWETKIDSDEDIKDVYSKAEDYMYRKKITESQSMRNQTIRVILHTLHEANPREKIHSERVSKLSRMIGQIMGLDEEELKEIEISGLMHDIGKIAINSNILNKPGKLTHVEYDEIKRHPEISYHILKSVDVYTKLADYVLSHHEKWDGTGYPRGLAGEKIPLVARIITIADAYEAMTAKRPYKDSYSHEEAVKELKRCAGTHFDKNIVDVCDRYCSQKDNDWIVNL